MSEASRLTQVNVRSVEHLEWCPARPKPSGAKLSQLAPVVSRTGAPGPLRRAPWSETSSRPLPLRSRPSRAPVARSVSCRISSVPPRQRWRRVHRRKWRRGGREAGSMSSAPVVVAENLAAVPLDELAPRIDEAHAGVERSFKADVEHALQASVVFSLSSPPAAA